MVPDLSPEDYSPAGDGVCPRPVPPTGGCGLDSMKFAWKHMRLSHGGTQKWMIYCFFFRENPCKVLLKWMMNRGTLNLWKHPCEGFHSHGSTPNIWFIMENPSETCMI